jgi:hypothetical protein
VLSPPTLGSCSIVASVSEPRIVEVIPSQFFFGLRTPEVASGVGVKVEVDSTVGMH